MEQTKIDEFLKKYKGYEVRMVMPKAEVFRNFIRYENVMNPAMQASNLVHGSPIFERAEYPKEGGILRYYQGFKFPEKGFAFPQAVYACNFAKRELLAEFRFFAKHPLLGIQFFNKKVLNDFIDKYITNANQMMSQFFFKDEYYMQFSRQVRAFMNGFLGALGVSNDNLALIFATFLEDDNAYRNRIQDLALETTKEKLIKDFPKEIERLLLIFKDREFGDYNVDKLRAIVKIIKVGWYVPRFRRAIRAGLNAMDWEKFLPDEADKHIWLIRGDYNHFGRSGDDRWEEWLKIYDNNPPKLIYLIQRPPNDNEKQ